MEIIKNDKCEIIKVGNNWQVVAFSKDYVEKYKDNDMVLNYNKTIDEIFKSEHLTSDILVFYNGYCIFDFKWYDVILSVRENFRLKRVDFKYSTKHKNSYFYPATKCFCMYNDNPSLREITKAISEAFRFSRGIEPTVIDTKKDMLTYITFEDLVPSKKKKKTESNI